MARRRPKSAPQSVDGIIAGPSSKTPFKAPPNQRDDFDFTIPKIKPSIPPVPKVPKLTRRRGRFGRV